MANDQILTQFQEDSEADNWKPVNDGVMGGCSNSEFIRSENGTGVFRGEVSLENNGGFASVRRPIEASTLADYTGLQMRLRGDGKLYGINIRMGGEFVDTYYQVQVETKIGEWMDVRADFADFEAKKHGQPVAEAPPLDPASIEGIGLIISKQPGEFALEIDSIKAFR
ncbi:CIA30 family protein [bacterium]|nr:CIA30 family protein [bacterium]